MPVETISESVRARVAVVALCLVLSILILYRTGSDLDERRDRVRPRSRRSRRQFADAPEVGACEILASPYSPFARRIALRPGARLVWTGNPVGRPRAPRSDLVPFVPSSDPYSRN